MAPRARFDIGFRPLGGRPAAPPTGRSSATARPRYAARFGVTMQPWGQASAGVARASGRSAGGLRGRFAVGFGPPPRARGLGARGLQSRTAARPSAAPWTRARFSVHAHLVPARAATATARGRFSIDIRAPLGRARSR